jgi:hypothetical protein
MTQNDIRQQRLSNQRLIATSFTQPGDVVRWLGAVQAQEYPGATWGLAQRASSLTQASIDQAFAEGAILRTHAMRPTWHFVAPDDIRWLLKLTSPRVHAINASYYRKLGLDAGALARGEDVLAKALHGGKHLTRAELAACLEQAGIVRPTDDRLRLTYLMMHAELEGLICSGATRGKQHTYALLDERVAPAPALERDAALAELTRRYFTSHGPATVKDFTWWSGLSTADAKVGLEMNRPLLETITVEGQAYWFAPAAPATPAAAPIAHLLPAYDEYTIAYKDHSAILDPRYREQVVVAFGIVIVLDGWIVGVWKRVLTNKSAILSLRPFAALSREQSQAIEQAIQRYAAFLQRPVVLAAPEAA